MGLSLHAQDGLLKSLARRVAGAAPPGNFPINTVLGVFDKKSDDFMKNVEISLFNH